MDKAEFQTKLDEINRPVEQKDYESAIEIVDGIEWRRVKSIRILCTVGEIYAANKRYEDSRSIFLLAYHRSPVGKTILYRLIEVCIKMGNLDEALEYYGEFVEAAPNDNIRYVLKYKIDNARNAALEEQIQTLEEYKEKEFTERWSYELAKLYYRAGESDKCIQLCDDIHLWFSEGKYVVKSLDLKKRMTDLTPSQEKVYSDYFNPKKEKTIENVVTEQVETKEEIKEEAKENITEIEETSEVKTENIPEEIVSAAVEETEPAKEAEEKMRETIENIALSAPIIDTDENFQEKISKGIKDIFNTSSKKRTEEQEEELVEKQITGQINIADILGTDLPGSDVPVLEPENISVDTLPKLNIPAVNLNEMAKVEDLPFTINLEDTILAAAKEQGIDLPDSDEVDLVVSAETIVTDDAIEEEVLEVEDQPEIEETIPSQEEVVEEVQLSEEEKLMRFIDEQNVDPNLDPKDIIPREDKLDEDEQKIFSYFSSIPGLREQIVDALKDTQMAASDKTSSFGNVIVMGNKGSGKTTLATALIKAICNQLNMPASKVAKIDAAILNQQDIPKVIDKLSGGFLLIYNTNQLNENIVEDLNKAMEFRTDGLTVIIEDEKINMRKFISKYPKFIEKFTSTVAIPVFTNDELVSFSKVYTDEMGYKIDDMAILALYTLISDNQKEDEPMTVEGVRILIDNAIAKAESGTRKLQRNLSKTRTDHEGKILLHEKDFK